MNAPRVSWLKYELKTDPSLKFAAADLDWDAEAFCVRLDKKQLLTVSMKRHFESIQEARNAVELFLEAWEIHFALIEGRREIAFEYLDGEIVDLAPSASGSVIALSGVCRVTASLSARATIVRNRYPEPPAGFLASPDVVSLWDRLDGYLQGREPLLTMAYFCLSFIERSRFASRTAAAAQLGLDVDILNMLGEITAVRGDAQSARKVGAQSTNMPTPPDEVSWVETATRLLIRRLGEYEFGSSRPFPLLEMNALPPLLDPPQLSRGRSRR